MRRLPSLTALRAFEAAGRHESFSDAGDELNISHSAISQHVRQLEDWLEHRLFDRMGNRVVLNEEGHILCGQLSEAFHIIESALMRYQPDDHSVAQLTVVAEPAFAKRWLMPRLVDFRQAFPTIDLRLGTDSTLTGQRLNASDIVIHFETDAMGFGGTATRLFPIDAVPACAPALRQSLPKTIDSIAKVNAPLIHDYGHSAWRLWFQTHEPKSRAWKRGVVYSDLSLALDAAAAGEGIVLTDPIISGDEFASGALVPLMSESVLIEHYSLVQKDSKHNRRARRCFSDWLKSASAEAFVAQV